ncbi:MAG: hypothetical protein Q9188_006388 [Gyalolechia gomerana]
MVACFSTGWGKERHQPNLKECYIDGTKLQDGDKSSTARGIGNRIGSCNGIYLLELD